MGTPIAFAVATGFLWLKRGWLLGAWLSPFDRASRAFGPPYVMDQANLAAVTIHVLLVTAVLLTLPVFCAESWLLLCRLTRRNDARRLAAPIAVTSAGSALLALWFAHQVALKGFFSYVGVVA